MKRLSIGISVLCAIVGSGVILLSGVKSSSGMEEWELLNSRVESVVVDKSKNQAQIDASGKVDQASKSSPAQAVTEVVKGTGNMGASNSALSASSGETQPEGTSTAAKSASGAQNSSVDVPNEIKVPVAGGGQENSGAAVQKINVNTAGLAELTNIPGIGEKKAQAILDYRSQHGSFQKVSDLDKVKGIGAKMLEKMKPYVEL